MDNQLSRPASFTFGFFKRFAKLSILGIVSLGLNGIAVFEGAHMGVENVKHAPDIDPETNGSDAGGTDPAPRFKGRHAVRVVWVTQNRGSAPHTSVVKHTDSLCHSGLNYVCERVFDTCCRECGGRDFHGETAPTDFYRADYAPC
ncbi:hypothetical protein EV401DRAFT_1998406 [Pisolithus croceorrhizus]|nr:hypothetical protein EV401DRAFT_1998406 [Pisolithus croceorrhizus]